MKFIVNYAEYLAYTEEIDADTPDEASDMFIKMLTENTIEPDMTEIDMYEITRLSGGDEHEGEDKERGANSWATNHQC